MALTKLEILRDQVLQDGKSFGAVGAYRRLDGIAHYAVDPADPANAGVTDLALAARGSDGLVHFDGDFTLLMPVDPARANGSLLVEVPNRGNRTALRSFNRAPFDLMPTDEIDPGDGFLMQQGWCVAFVGWQWDMPDCVERLGLRAPQVPADTRGDPGQMHLRIQPDQPAASYTLTDHHVGAVGNHAPIAPASANDPQDRLLVRELPYGEARELPREAWRFETDEHDELTRFSLDGGFQPGLIYDLIYTPRDCPVVGAGLLAVRDFAAFARDHADSPVSAVVEHTIGEGISQCGRFLRTLMYLGLNRTEAGTRALDGVLAHIAGGRRGEFNSRHGQPSVQPTPGFGHLFPFSDTTQTDPQTGRTEGLLDRLRDNGTMPKLMYTDTSSEYWRGDAGLTHLDLTSGADLEPPDDVRRYLFASTQHGPGVLPFTNTSMFGSRATSPFNVVDYRPLFRAALENLRRWIVDDLAPPASLFPRQADGTAASRESVIEQVADNSALQLEARQLPAPQCLPALVPLDLGPRAEAGIGAYPARVTGERYRTVVSAVDAAGNETGGVRMPDVSVPVAAHTGFTPRHEDTGGPGQILEYVGATWLLRDLPGRYASREDYLGRVREAARELVEERYLLADDIEVCVQIAAERYDAAMEALGD